MGYTHRLGGLENSTRRKLFVGVFRPTPSKMGGSRVDHPHALSFVCH